MPKEFTKNEIVDFDKDTPTRVVLDINPNDAKGKEYEGNWGPYKKFMYFCEGNKMFFATEVLHKRLIENGISKGDAVVINRKGSITEDGKQIFTWAVQREGGSSPVGVGIPGNNQPVMETLIRIESKLDALVSDKFPNKSPIDEPIVPKGNDQEKDLAF